MIVTDAVHPTGSDSESAALAVELLMACLVSIEPMSITFRTRIATARARMTYRHTARVEQSRVEPVIVTDAVGIPLAWTGSRLRLPWSC